MFSLFVRSLSAFHFREVENETQMTRAIGGRNNVIAMYYKNGCNACETVLPFLNRTAKLFQNMTVLSINCMNYDNMMLCYNNQIDRYPTIHFYRARSRKPLLFNDYRSFEFFVDFVNENTNQTVEISPKDREFVKYKETEIENMKKNGTPFMMFFYKPWCRFCHFMFPNIKELKKIFRRDKDVKIGVFNCEKNRTFCKEFKYQPIVMMYKGNYSNEFKKGNKLDYFVEFVNKEFGTHRTIDGFLENTVGVIPELDKVVEEFFNNRENRKSTIKKVNDMNDERKELYLAYMNELDQMKTLKEENDYVQSEIHKLKDLLKDETDDSVDIDSAQIKFNVISVFDRKIDMAMRMSEL